VHGRTAEPFAGNLSVGEVTSGKVRSCRPHDTINIARATIAQEVRRLLVINSLGTLEGILTMDEVIAHAEGVSIGKRPEISFEKIVKTLEKGYETQAMFVRSNTAGS
jgi:hypothetical protein